MQAAECNYKTKRRVGPEPAACLFMSVQPRRLTGLFVTASVAYAWELQRYYISIKAESNAESIQSTLLLLLSFSL
jgi:hypothetical protein